MIQRRQTMKPISPKPYSAPPIVAAIIELRFENPVTDDVRENVSKKLASRYPLHSELVQQHVQVQVQPNVINTQAVVQGRISQRMSADANEIVSVAADTFSIQLSAPYPGWDSLFDRLKSDWALAKRIWGYRKIQRVGVRYLNRIDLREREGGYVDYERYLNLRINLPPDFPPIGRYDLAFQFALAEIKCGATVRSGIADPAVPGSTSFTLDLDVFRLADVPQQEKDVYKLLADMRSAKNSLFETFITDDAREIFNAAG